MGAIIKINIVSPGPGSPVTRRSAPETSPIRLSWQTGTGGSDGRPVTEGDRVTVDWEMWDPLESDLSSPNEDLKSDRVIRKFRFESRPLLIRRLRVGISDASGAMGGRIPTPEVLLEELMSETSPGTALQSVTASVRVYLPLLVYSYTFIYFFVYLYIFLSLPMEMEFLLSHLPFLLICK